ncbi:hypothetical protein CNEO3_70117 [Clostridium neonatale]|nr:hypothetical protein CNEO3_70117 [Clostridium neonatale]
MVIKLECPAESQRSRKQGSDVQAKRLHEKNIVHGKDIIRNGIKKGNHNGHNIIFIEKNNEQNTGKCANPHNQSFFNPDPKQCPEPHRLPSLEQQNRKIYQSSNCHKTNSKQQ